MAPISTDDLRSSTVKSTKIQNTDTKQPIATSMAESKMPSYPGLGRWTLLETIGKGGFSNVYRAEDSTSEYGEVAIKVMRKYEMNKQQIDNMNKEIHILEEAKHPHIVQFIDSFETRQYCYIIMELCTGGELFNQVIKLTYLSEDLSRHVILQVAKAVEYLHGTLGVVHRDIKPENIFFYSIPWTQNNKINTGLDEEKADEGEFIPGVGCGGIGKIKLGDFGLSKLIYGYGNQTMTPCGTMGYAAPELISDQGYSMGVDMWALGCVLFTLLVGFPPFYDPNIGILKRQVTRGEYTFQSPWWDSISQDAKDLVSNLLTVDPGKRFTIQEFMAHPWIKQGLGETKSAYATPSPDSQTATSEKDSTSNHHAVKNDRLATPRLAAGNEVGFRTPDTMNVREIFDVAFGVHQHEEERKRQERIAAGGRATPAGPPLGSFNRANQGISTPAQLRQPRQTSVSPPCSKGGFNRREKPQEPQSLFKLSMQNSLLLEKRRQMS
ncbi:uncharacterized protein N7446_010350 [Penicillium canescens]|uniref:Protein kinase domain-containing protein n=1 Tax=Penicillium canescens TaxID=5083 RepID=A0AAD6N6Z6_PENCN|nr:uncharacterized protein N7446_010350 [Penicillium canescens]KAJ6035588.1 hypothetical protein N7460_009763 [Penicillium canescens]KAJ6037711.1 hypothetical protein N7444_010416 [Penicillium canescens]KAJ6054338.1 hypothetical protein N7446_010350 [Penicillium canescens]